MILLRASSELDIAAPPERLFDLLAPERTLEWDRSILSVAQIHGPLGPGARYRETHRVLLRAHAIDLEVTDYEPAERIAYRTVSGGPPSTTRYELVPSSRADLGEKLGRSSNRRPTHRPCPAAPARDVPTATPNSRSPQELLRRPSALATRRGTGVAEATRWCVPGGTGRARYGACVEPSRLDLQRLIACRTCSSVRCWSNRWIYR